jgi:hypothetical protein
MKPSQSAKNVSGDSENFTNLMRRLMQVPHSEIKAKLDAEKAEKRASMVMLRHSSRLGCP